MLERALELAERGRGTTHPNPVVGAVVVRDGEVVGEGWHQRKGGPHAEVFALEAAGEAARGATLYVTLEPCRSWGHTPPCTKAVLESGVTRVVAGALDPSPKAGGGLEELRSAGIEVELVDSWAARRQNEAWRTWVSLGRPFVTYKAAVTLDGRMTLPGERWVSGEESRRLVHELRGCRRRVDLEAQGSGFLLDGRYASALSDDPGEHALKATSACFSVTFVTLLTPTRADFLGTLELGGAGGVNPRFKGLLTKAGCPHGSCTYAVSRAS